MPKVNIEILKFNEPVYRRGETPNCTITGYTGFREPGILSVSRSPHAWTNYCAVPTDPIYAFQKPEGSLNFAVLDRVSPGNASILKWAIGKGYLDSNGQHTKVLYKRLNISNLMTTVGVADEAASIAWALDHLQSGGLDDEIHGVWFLAPSFSANVGVTRGGIFFSKLNHLNRTNVTSSLVADPHLLPNHNGIDVTF